MKMSKDDFYFYVCLEYYYQTEKFDRSISASRDQFNNAMPTTEEQKKQMMNFAKEMHKKTIGLLEPGEILKNTMNSISKFSFGFLEETYEIYKDKIREINENVIKEVAFIDGFVSNEKEQSFFENAMLPMVNKIIDEETNKLDIEDICSKFIKDKQLTFEDAENGLRQALNLKQLSIDDINKRLSNLKEDRENSDGNISFNRSLENVSSSIDNLLFQFDVFISLDTEKEDNKYLFEAYRNIKNDLLGMKSFIYARKFKVNNPNCFKKI